MHAKLFAQWLQGTRCNSESSAWPILQFLYMGAAPEERDFPWLIELVFWCLLHTFVHLGSMRDRPMLFCILMILRNTTFSWIRLGELPLPSGKLGCLRGTEPCKKAWNGGRNGRDVCCVALSLSLSLSHSHLRLIRTKRGTRRWGRVLPTQAMVEWFVKFQMPAAISQLVLEHALAPHWVGPLVKIRQEPRLANTCRCLFVFFPFDTPDWSRILRS